MLSETMQTWRSLTSGWFQRLSRRCCCCQGRLATVTMTTSSTSRGNIRTESLSTRRGHRHISTSPYRWTTHSFTQQQHDR